MPITQSVNSKANVKKQTNQDLPFAPQQPVMNSFYAVSTAAQTVINLSFSVDTVNLVDQFFLWIDGRLQRLGASNDYQFTSIGSNGYSSQVTMNNALALNQNIQAKQFGLKKESEFNMDNRFTQLYAAEGAGFQAFVDQTSFINTATTTTGSPAAGTFYSSIIGRAPMVDLSQNLKAQMGIERVMTQQISLVQNEFGPNGEPIWSTPNDIFGQIRFVGSGWSNVLNTAGSFASTGTAAGISTAAYVEITFYGTGLNIICIANSSTKNFVAAVDGGSEGSNLLSGSLSAVLTSRGYAQNNVIPVASGLTLGTHTVKIRNTGSSDDLAVYGFEILNESSLIKILPGVGYVQGQKYTSSALQSFLSNADATGTRGGRVVVYQNGDGTIGRAWRAVNTSQANLNSADHTNEEVARSYFWREFTAGRSDDFYVVNLNTVTAARVFTLDDGTTSLTCDSPYNSKTDSANPIDAMQQFNSSTTTFTFIGTGLDIVRSAGAGGTGTMVQSVSVDGTSIGNIPTTLSAGQILTQNIVSGLPYGTHTVVITRVSGTTGEGFSSFIVYQPKKPSIPSGVVELSDFNVLANYINGTATAGTINSQGIIQKVNAREFIYAGTWAVSGVNAGIVPGGLDFRPSTNGAYVEYTFFGTGFAVSDRANTTCNFTFTLDGSSNFTGLTVNKTAAGTFTVATGTYTHSSNSTGFIAITGLAAAKHTVRVTFNDAASVVYFWGGMQIITPIHSIKSNLTSDLQNTLTVGSQGLSDNRKLTPVKDLLPVQKAWVQATGIASSPTTSSTSYVPVPDMSCTVKTGNSMLQIFYSASCYNTSGTPTSPLAGYMQVFIDGVAVGTERQAAMHNSADTQLADMQLIPVSAGTHKVELYWHADSGTMGVEANRRVLSVQER